MLVSTQTSQTSGYHDDSMVRYQTISFVEVHQCSALMIQQNFVCLFLENDLDLFPGDIEPLKVWHCPLKRGSICF